VLDEAAYNKLGRGDNKSSSFFSRGFLGLVLGWPSASAFSLVAGVSFAEI